MTVAGEPGEASRTSHFDAQTVSRHVGPWLIALGVAIKSVLALATAIGLEIWGAKRMHDWIGLQIVRHHLDPDHGFFAEAMRGTRDGPVHVAVLLLVAYALLHGAEAWGLWKDKPWASWFGVLGASLYLSVTGLALWSRPNWFTASALAINLAVVLVLAWNIRALRTRRSASGE